MPKISNLKLKVKNFLDKVKRNLNKSLLVVKNISWYLLFKQFIKIKPDVFMVSLQEINVTYINLYMQ